MKKYYPEHSSSQAQWSHQHWHQHHWLVNLAASSLILFAVVGSVSLFAPELKQTPAADETHFSSNLGSSTVQRDEFDRSYIHQASPDREILNMGPKAEHNLFTRVKKVTA